VRKSSITFVQTAMKNGLLGSDVINGAMLQFTDLSLADTWLIDDEVDSIDDEVNDENGWYKLKKLGKGRLCTKYNLKNLVKS